MINLFKKLWQKCFLRRYLINLIQSQIELERKISELAQIENFKKLRWNEIISNLESDFILKKITNNLVVKLHKDTYLGKAIYFNEFENNEILFLQRVLRDNDNFIDIGANIGLFTLYASEKIKIGRLIAFEPTPQTFKYLEENISFNRICNIDLYQQALSNKKDLLKFRVSKNGYDAFNGFIDGFESNQFDCIEVSTINFDTIDLSKLRFVNNLTLIKIDVEGWELPVLEGAKNFLIKNEPVIIIEFTDDNALKAGFSCKAVYNYLTAIGYKWYEYNGQKNELFESELKEKYPYNNLIACKNIRILLERLNGE